MSCRVYYVLNLADCPLIEQVFYLPCFLQIGGYIQGSIKAWLFFFFFGKNTLYECYALPIASYWEAIMSVNVTFNGSKIDWWVQVLWA